MQRQKTEESIYRITYQAQGKVIELYARQVFQGGMYGFVEVEDLLFEEQGSQLLVDPELEKIKTEFENVEITFIPMHTIIRIDQVKKLGEPKIRLVEGGEHQTSQNVSYLPGLFPPNHDND